MPTFKKISELPPIPTIVPTIEFEINNLGVSQKATLTQIQDHLKKTVGRDFILNMNINITLGNSVLFGNFNGDASKWTIFNIFTWTFPVGVKFKIKRFTWNVLLNTVSGSTILEIDKTIPAITAITSLGSTGVGFGDSGILNKEYEQILPADSLLPRLYKFIPIGASGNITGTAQLYCEWIVHPTEVP